MRWKGWAAVVAVGVMLGGATVRWPAQVGAIWSVQVNPGFASGSNLILFPCTVNGHAFSRCELDTGNGVGLLLSPADASAAGVKAGQKGSLGTIGGDAAANYVTATLAVTGRSASVVGMIDSAYVGGPLIGVAPLRALGIEDVLIDLQGPSLIFVDNTPQ